MGQKLGQHFLKDANIARKIVKLAEIEPGEEVWEIGPGEGILTSALVEVGARLTAFEIDKALIPALHDRFGSAVRLVNQDILQTDWPEFLPDHGAKLVANLPYQITSPFFHRLVQYAAHFQTIVVMIQKEFAQRVTALPGTKDWSPLTIRMGYYFQVKYEFTVKPQVFFPPPKVESAVIKLLPRPEAPTLPDPILFWQLVETSFRFRRKTLRNNWKGFLTESELSALTDRFDLQLRAEKLDENDFIRLCEIIRQIRKKGSVNQN